MSARSIGRRRPQGLISVVVTVVWQNAPFSFIIFLAGLQTIDPDVWAAAKVDGAGPYRRFSTSPCR